MSADTSINTSGSSNSSTVAAYTPQEIAAELNIGEGFADWLAKQRFTEDDPLLILQFNDDEAFQHRGNVINALLQNGGHASDFLDVVIKFDTYVELYAAKRALKTVVPWAFYMPEGCFNQHGVLRYPQQPRISTSLVGFYSDKSDKLTMNEFQFFEIA
ncbi:hypothetical protein ACQ4LE_000425 [Meloidogyne hapla]|uniref:SAM-dependent methyltransferase n=1 Tax=Meloidogyne hapla TaxID=6305 RepID=A0A1I8AZ61_MELHA